MLMNTKISSEGSRADPRDKISANAPVCEFWGVKYLRVKWKGEFELSILDGGIIGNDDAEIKPNKLRDRYLHTYTMHFF